jgi:dTMP kinase
LVLTSAGGLFISIEGPDGSGKTTQARMLQEKLEKRGRRVLLTREPGGTSIGEEVRGILLNPLFCEMTVPCEIFLYGAARAQLVSQVIRPSLEKGTIVISDRFIDSSIAYQGYAGGEDPEMIHTLNLWATAGLLPGKTFLLDLPVEKGLERLQSKPGEYAGGDRIERKNEHFHRRVRAGFLQLAKQDPQRIFLVNAEKPPEKVHEQIWGQVRDLL